MNQPDTHNIHRNYFTFVFWNTLSFSVLAGNIIILYVLRLGVGNILIGFLTSMNYFAFLIPLLGRQIIRKTGAIKLFGTA